MDDCGFDTHRAKLLEDAGRLDEAAECHISEGNTIEAIKLLLRDTALSSRTKAEHWLLDGLWQQLSFGLTVPPDIALSGTSLGDLLTASTRMVEDHMLSAKGHDEVSLRFHVHVSVYLEIFCRSPCSKQSWGNILRSSKR